MRRSFGLRLWLGLGALLALTQVQCLLIPDDTIEGERVANKRPSVRITAGAATADTTGTNYKVDFKWNGIDDDGVVALFQFAVDDTVTEDAWTDTTGFGARINFRASTQSEEASADTSYTDWHTFYIRAIDNEFSVSRPDKRFFNAVTIAPTSRIDFPDLSGSLVPQLQRTVVMRWSGEDLDSSQPDQRPVAYELKLVRVRNSFDPDTQIADSLRRANNLLLDTLQVGSKVRWVRVPETTRSLVLRDLPAQETLAFGVRAVDEAGAVEPRYERNRNFIAFDVTGTPGVPTITIDEPTLEAHTFPQDGSIWDISVPTNRPLRFEWTGDASAYGSEAGNSNYALDIPDVEDDDIRDPNGIGGWIGWGDWEGVQTPIIFGDEEGGTTHNFWLKMRDISDSEASERIGRVRIYVVPFTFEKFGLIMDESKFPVRPPVDAEHDAFIDSYVGRRMFDLGDVDHLPMYPPQGNLDERRNPAEYSLETFAQYQHILWHLNLASSGLQGLYLHEVRLGRVSTYSAAGGRIFLIGGRISGYMLGLSSGGGNFGYPKRHPDDPDQPGYEKDSFIWNFMRYRNEIVSQRAETAQLAEASGIVGARSLHSAPGPIRTSLSTRKSGVLSSWSTRIRSSVEGSTTGRPSKASSGRSSGWKG